MVDDHHRMADVNRLPVRFMLDTDPKIQRTVDEAYLAARHTTGRLAACGVTLVAVVAVVSHENSPASVIFSPLLCPNVSIPKWVRAPWWSSPQGRLLAYAGMYASPRSLAT